MNFRRFVLRLALASSALAILAGVPATAMAEYPEKPIKLVIPYPPGAPDVFGRLLADRLSKRLGQPIVVENKPGAGGGVGAQSVARSPADGYTLLFGGGSLFLINPSVYKSIIYERSQFSPVAVIAEVPFVFAARKDLPANNLAELATLMKKEPGKVRFGNGSIGSQFHMLWEQYKSTAQLSDNSVMVGANLVTTLLNGDVDVTVLTPSPLMQYFEQGGLKPLAVTGARRLAKLPTTQTVTEAGFPALENVADYFLMAPKGTPQAVVDKLAREIAALGKDPDYVARLAEQYGVPGRASNPAEFEKVLDVKTKEWTEIVKKSGVSIQ